MEGELNWELVKRIWDFIFKTKPSKQNTSLRMLSKIGSVDKPFNVQLPITLAVNELYLFIETLEAQESHSPFCLRPSFI